MDTAPAGSLVGTRHWVVAAVFVIVATAVGACGAVEPPPVAPIVGGPVVCQGVPAPVCQQAVAEARANAAPNETIVQVRIACNGGTCTKDVGDAQVDVLYANGRRDTSTWGWTGEVAPILELPVDPICNGIPDEPCRDAALSLFGAITDQDVVSIVVTCDSPECTATRGEAAVIATSAGGATETTDYGYEGEN
jgi:hypothetical protein